MNKTLLRFLIAELLERLAQYRLLLTEATLPPGLEATLLKQVDALSLACLTTPVTLSGREVVPNLGEVLYSEQSIADVDCIKLLKSFVFRPFEVLQSLTTPLQACLSGTLPSQLAFVATDFTLASGRASNLKSPLPKPSVVLTPETMMVMPANDTWGCTPLSLLKKNSPLAWVSLVPAWADFALNYDDDHPLIQQLSQHLPPDVSPQLARTITVACMALRMYGPAYYFYVVLEALLKQDLTILQWVEPLLFRAVNHAALTDKALVILHEVAETARLLYPQISVNLATSDKTSTMASISHAWSINGWTEDWLCDIEQLIPAKEAFGDKQLDKVLLIQERLDQGILLSSLGRFNLDDLQIQLSKALPANQDNPNNKINNNIYHILEQVTEYPNSPRAMINATWLHKMHRSALTLFKALSLSKTIDELDAVFNQPLIQQDLLLLKSIETSEIHRGLLQPTG
jgi:hypothetical protein